MIDEAAHEAEVRAWRQARLGRLTAPDGWLSVVDRIPLAEGETRLPIGLVRVEAGAAILRPAPGVEVGGRPAAAPMPLGSEAVLHGGRRWELVRRGPELALRVKDPRSAARLDFRGLAYFPVDARWRLEVPFVPSAARDAPGEALLTLDGAVFRLGATRDGQRLSFLFADATNRDETYAAGRFLYAPEPRGGKVVLDFNLAFNPPCAFSRFVACPVVPEGHRLPVRITAGEMRPEPLASGPSLM